MENTKADLDIINHAYEAVVTKIFNAYVDNLTSGDEGQAEQLFKNGIALARRARDRAKALVQG